MKLFFTTVVVSLILLSYANPQDITFNKPVKINGDASKNFYWPYYVYIPDTIVNENNPLTFLIIPNNTGKVNDSLEVHEERVLRTINNISPVVNQLNVAVLVPVFPRSESNWKEYTHALDRDVMISKNDSTRRLDLQLLAMINNTKELLGKKNIHVNEKIIMMGFSASGMFVNRFVFIHPDKVLAAAIGSPGGWPIVPASGYNSSQLNYPVGINDFQEITGKPYNPSELKKVKMFFFLGEKDNNDSVVFDDSYDEPERKVVLDNFGANLQERWKTAESIYNREGFSNASFTLYTGLEHTVTGPVQKDIMEFFIKALK